MLGACTPLSDATPDTETLVVDMHLSYASAKGTEFEQYKLLPRGMFVECGVVSSEERTALQQGIVSISERTRTGAALLASEIFALVDPGAPLRESTKGGAGLAELTFGVDGRQVELKTSLGALESPTTDQDALVMELSEVLRGAVKEPLCGKERFYGISRRKVVEQVVTE